jgi:hypothetical protein
MHRPGAGTPGARPASQTAWRATGRQIGYDNDHNKPHLKPMCQGVRQELLKLAHCRFCSVEGEIVGQQGMQVAAHAQSPTGLCRHVSDGSAPLADHALKHTVGSQHVRRH